MYFEYKYDFPSLEQIDDFVIECQNIYNKQMFKLKDEYYRVLLSFDMNTYKKILNQKRKLDIKIIKKVILYFDSILKDIDIKIFMHGSYTKSLNRLNSDIDITMLYDNKYRSKLLIIEELICKKI